jgi:hypothetical protein
MGVTMTKRMHTPTFLALLIAAMLASAYLIVVRNDSAMSGSARQPPAGMFH